MANFKSKLQGDVLIALFYFFVYSGAAAYLAFYNPFIEDVLKFNGAQIGIINGIFQGMMLLAVVAWGVLSDKKGLRFSLTISLLATAILVFFLQYFHQFGYLIIYMFLFAFFYHPNPPLIDTLAINHARNFKSPAFGKYRLWGSLGWGTATLVIGALIADTNIVMIFYASALGFLTLFILVSVFVQTDPDRVKGSLINFKDFKIIFANRKLAFFFIIIFLYGISITPLNYYINLYFKDIGASNSMVGYAFSVQAFTEIPFFFYADRIVQRFGARNAILVTIAVTIVRMILYSMISDPLLALPLGALHGFTLSIFLVAVVNFVHELVPPHWRATAQSLIWAFHFGAGVTVGNVLIGFWKDTTSMRDIMFWMSMAVIFMAVLFYVFFQRLRKSN